MIAWFQWCLAYLYVSAHSEKLLEIIYLYIGHSKWNYDVSNHFLYIERFSSAESVLSSASLRLILKSPKYKMERSWVEYL